MATLPNLSVPAYGSEEYFKNLADIYGATTAPGMARSTAQLKTLLGGRGTLGGTPLYGKYVEQIEKPYQTGLQSLLGQEVSGASRYFAEKPLQEAQLTGMYGGLPTLASQQLSQQTALQAGQLTGQYGGTETLAKQEFERQYAQMTPYQKETLEVAKREAELGNYKMLWEFFASTGWGQALLNALGIA